MSTKEIIRTVIIVIMIIIFIIFTPDYKAQIQQPLAEYTPELFGHNTNSINTNSIESALLLKPDTFQRTGQDTYSGIRVVPSSKKEFYVEGNFGIMGNTLNTETGQLYSQLDTGEKLYSEKSRIPDTIPVKKDFGAGTETPIDSEKDVIAPTGYTPISFTQPWIRDTVANPSMISPKIQEAMNQAFTPKGTGGIPLSLATEIKAVISASKGYGDSGVYISQPGGNLISSKKGVSAAAIPFGVGDDYKAPKPVTAPRFAGDNRPIFTPKKDAIIDANLLPEKYWLDTTGGKSVTLVSKIEQTEE